MSSIDRKLDLVEKIGNEPGEKTVGPSGVSRERITKWSVYAALVIFCIYRIATFTPQPIDGPTTLRPILYSWFTWFLGIYGHPYARPEMAFAGWARFCSWILLIPPALTVLNYAWQHEFIRLPRPAAKVLCSRWLLFISVALCLIACRYPTLIENEFNPDEGQFVAAAHKLFYDPNFFHSVDCGTSGPINIYLLMLPAILGFTPDFASSRVLVILIIFLSAYLLYRSVALVTTDDLARFAILPFFGAFAVFKHPELIHYSSEHTPILLIAAALYCSVRLLHNPSAYRTPVLLLGSLASAAFFTKMQSVPVVMALAGVGILYVYVTGSAGRLWRPALLFCAGAAPLLVINAGMCLAGGVWNDFRITYIQSNWNYADVERRFTTDLPIFVAYLVRTHEVRRFLYTFGALACAYIFQRMRREATSETGAFLQMATVGAVIASAIFAVTSERLAMYAYLTTLAITVIPIYLLLLYRNRNGLWNTDPVRWFGFLALASVWAAVFAIYKAHKGFIHYLLFLFLPLSVAMAWMLIRQSGRSGIVPGNDRIDPYESKHRTAGRLAFLAFFLALSVAYQEYFWGFMDDHVFVHPASTIRAAESDFIRSLTDSKGRITVWGWNIHPFLGSGRVAATRDLNSANSFRGFDIFLVPPYDAASPGEKQVRDYYSARMLRDLRQNPAELFIDATGPASWFLSNPKYFGFEKVPEIAAFINANYVHLADLYAQRFYLRRDLAARRELALSQPLPAKNCTAGALLCIDKPVTLPQDFAPVQMPRHALLETEFLPITSQAQYATVFSNEAKAGSFQGFQFQHVANNRYRLVLGLGSQWAISKEILLPQRKPVSLSIELTESTATINCNGAQINQLRLPHPLADSPGPMSLNSWIGGTRVFSGKVQFFQIVDLERSH